MDLKCLHFVLGLSGSSGVYGCGYADCKKFKDQSHDCSGCWEPGEYRTIEKIAKSNDALEEKGGCKEKFVKHEDVKNAIHKPIHPTNSNKEDTLVLTKYPANRSLPPTCKKMYLETVSIMYKIPLVSTMEKTLGIIKLKKGQNINLIFPHF